MQPLEFVGQLWQGLPVYIASAAKNPCCKRLAALPTHLQQDDWAQQARSPAFHPKSLATAMFARRNRDDLRDELANLSVNCPIGMEYDMLRWSVSLGVLVALMASSNDLMAQRRQPLRNLARQIGALWGPGHHWQNPGPNIDYYMPYSETNTPQSITPGQPGIGQDIIINSQPGINQTIRSQNSTIQPPVNSATQLLRQPGVTQTAPAPGTRPIITQPAINQNTRINQQLQPYHQPAIPSRNLSIPSEPANERPSWQPTTNAPSNQWNSRYGDYFDRNQQPNRN